jgi:hypothetical protein
MPPIKKRLLDSRRVRRIRPGFSWIDRRFIRDGWIERLDRSQMLLYFFLVVVADKDGLSYYSDPRIRGTLRIEQTDLDRARVALLNLQLIAFDPPLYQVLALDPPPERTDGGIYSIQDIFRQLADGDPRR